MSEIPGVRRYNMAALAVLLTIGVFLGGYMIYSIIEQRMDRSAFTGLSAPRLEGPQGTDFESARGPIVLYDEDGDDVDARENVRFVAMKTGRSVTFADDPSAQVYGGTILRTSDDDREPSAGYIGLVKTGMSQGNPVFDAVVLRFSDMEKMKVARGITALDRPTLLPEGRIGMVVWDKAVRGTWVLVDLDSGKVIARKPVAGTMKSAGETPKGQDELAPEAVF
jgi:hypothetical protein